MDQLIFKKSERGTRPAPSFEKSGAGFSTVEIMIALAVMVMALTGVIGAAFGSEQGVSGVFGANFQNQDLLMGSQIAVEALNKAQELLEQQQAYARKDFNLVVSTSTTEDLDGFVYTKEVVVEQTNILTKKVTARVLWNDVRGIERNVELVTFLTNFNNSIGGNTCSSVLSGDWSNPELDTFTAGAGSMTMSDVDAYKGKLYVTASQVAGPTDPVFFVFDIDDPLDVDFLGSFDNATSVSSGYAAVRVAENLNDGTTYAYLANTYGPDFGVCVQSPRCSQLQILDVSDPDMSGTPDLVSYKLPSVTGGNQGVGRSLFYKNNYVFLGLESTNGHGPELHIVAVGDTSNPFEVGRWPSAELGHAVNAITVHGNRAYVSTADDVELRVLDVSNPFDPYEIGDFDAPGGGGSQGNGKSVYAVGDTLYFGRTGVTGTTPELYVLNNTDPTDLEGNNPNPVIRDVGNVGNSVVDLIARDDLGFYVTTSNRFEVVDLKTGGLVGSVALNGDVAGLDCEGDTLYAVSSDPSGGFIVTVITPGS